MPPLDTRPFSCTKTNGEQIRHQETAEVQDHLLETGSSLTRGVERVFDFVGKT